MGVCQRATELTDRELVGLTNLGRRARAKYYYFCDRQEPRPFFFLEGFFLEGLGAAEFVHWVKK